ncbi:hypothetical protein BN8_05914 [Fibrisoma limi BUZ 3]|uniref:Uncharacterized protein n=1 Tax=Fibrisoma limi BUZ 3 TaxID=1185876 RepID=I2GRN1_9BACT|nr:hypothetical protein BN8_05914 [Fibrisoma limi BUZ 3]
MAGATLIGFKPYCEQITYGLLKGFSLKLTDGTAYRFALARPGAALKQQQVKRGNTP